MSTPDCEARPYGIPYSETVAAKPPNKFSSNQQSQNGDETSTFYNTVTVSPALHTNGQSGTRLEDETREKIHGLLPQAAPASAHGSQTSLFTDDRAPSSLTSAPSIPQIRVDSESEQITPKPEDSGKKWLSVRPKGSRTNSQKSNTEETLQPFRGIALNLPISSLNEELHSKNMQFSNRGSMFLDGRKVSPAESVPGNTLSRPTMGTQRMPTSSSVPDRLPLRIMSTDDEVLSEKVRWNYAHGSDVPNEGDMQSEMINKMGSSWRKHLGAETDSVLTTSRAPSTTDLPSQNAPSVAPSKEDNISREEMELAGGLEDWQDIDNADVDRYGFIIPKRPAPKEDPTGIKRSPTVSGQGLQRVSTSLQLASEMPRRKRTIRRSSADGHHRPSSDTLDRTVSNQSAARPSSSRSSAGKHSAFRTASNRLPGHKDRRLLDEASDMFTLPRDLTAGPIARTATVDSDRSTKSKLNLESKATSTAARKKENEREEKWRKMARPMASSTKDPAHNGIGGGMLFTFPPPTDAKLISRTWKGIPDTWRAPAWHYFLSVSARKNPQSLPDDRLIQLFFDYQNINSPDDVQIDIDVPRTISSHIMFRRRYRGGQRLLFRVLHAMSLHWPETGYVQGMAALAATLLSYYEEEKAFVMLVRLWECRGLGKLYKEGFGGLMEALNDFESGWLGEGEVAKKLNDLNIVPTAYGTRWYLTLFNYSIPFPAQLRVWDVFMLLGDNTDQPPAPTRPPTSSKNKQPTTQTSDANADADPPFGTTLDVLHATSAALIDGMRDILLESDFENAMKVLTSWIPIRDEDLFMRVARAEWKIHGERKRRK